MSPVYEVAWKDASERGDYPHMAKHDAAIWERFLEAYAPHFTRFAYDVALGGFTTEGDATDEAQRKGWQYSTAKKIDVVAERPDDCWIIELRPHAGVSALGSALCYEVLAGVDKFTDKPVVAVVVTDRSDPDIRFCANELGVTLIEMDEQP